MALEWQIKARLVGFSQDEIPHTTRSEIAKRLEAKRLEQIPMLEAMVNLKLSQMSGYSMAKAEKEERDGKVDGKERALSKRGAEIVAEIRKAALFEVQPDFVKAEHISLYGWPGEESEGPQAFAGMPPECARALLELKDVGLATGVAAIWRAFRGNEPWKRLRVTAEG